MTFFEPASADKITPQDLSSLLLFAALSSGNSAVEAWRKWQLHVNENDLDPGFHRLIPLVYHNLLEQGVDSLELKNYKQINKFYWAKNQIIIFSAKNLLGKIDQAGIDFLVLKGLPLSVQYYAHIAHRPFADIDILIHPEDVKPVFSLLTEMGFHHEFAKFPDPVWRTRHSTSFMRPDGFNIDLHWRLNKFSWGNENDEDVWKSAIGLDLEDVRVATPNTSHHFWHTCVHGVEWSPVNSIRWVTDAMMIYRTMNGELDWEVILKAVQARRLNLQFRRQLLYLQDTFNLPVPSEVLTGLEKNRVWSGEKPELDIITKRWTAFGKVQEHWFAYWRKHPEYDFLMRLVRFPFYLMDTLHVRYSRPEKTRFKY